MLRTETVAELPANTERVCHVRRAALPLSCPPPEMVLWNSHPRVYLPIESEDGRSTCPYCGTQYVLAD